MVSPVPALPSTRCRHQGLDGAALALERIGARRAPPVIFAHGFAQTRRVWRTAARAAAARGFCAWLADGRGHGDSAKRPQYALEEFVADAVSIARRAGPDAVWVGHSMGGLVGLLAQAEHGPLFRGLVLVDITPRWEHAGTDRILGTLRAFPEGFPDLDEASRRLGALRPGPPPPRAKLRAALVRRRDGRYGWRFDPRLLDHVAAPLMADAARWQRRLGAALAGIDVPLRLVSGARSDLVSQRTVAEFRALAPKAEHVELPDAGHALAGDSHAAYAAAVLPFLDRFRARKPAGAFP